MHASGGIQSGIGGLLVVFVGAASLTLRGRQAFFAAAVAALAVLTEQAVSVLGQTSPSGEFVAAGVLGAIIFMIASAAYPLARRLEESEALARQRGIDLANLAQLNEYIIQNLRESIVVVDEANRIRLINQSAAEHAGIRTREPGQDLARLAPHSRRMLADWRRQGNPLLQPPSFLSADGTTRINAYLAPLGGREDGPVLMFLEDAGLLAQKVQQTKLAALGRLSASIAHEIRNPVGALCHASQLLEESPSLSPDDRRLIAIIQTNSRRVSEIVDNVLQLSRRENSRPELIYLASWTREFAAEFSSTLELYEGQVTVVAGRGRGGPHGPRPPAPDRVEPVRERREVRQRQRRHRGRDRLRPAARQSPALPGSGRLGPRHPGGDARADLRALRHRAERRHRPGPVHFPGALRVQPGGADPRTAPRRRQRLPHRLRRPGRWESLSHGAPGRPGGGRRARHPGAAGA